MNKILYILISELIGVHLLVFFLYYDGFHDKTLLSEGNHEQGGINIKK